MSKKGGTNVVSYASNELHDKSKKPNFIHRTSAMINNLMAIERQSYSEEKFKALEKYCSESTMYDQFKACLTVLFATVALVLIFHVWPLGSIEQGLSGNNWFFLLQITIAISLCSVSFLYRFTALIPDSIVTVRQQCITVALFVLMADLVVIVVGTNYFPLPFGFIEGGFSGCPVFLASWVFFEDKSILLTQVIAPVLSLIGSYTSMFIHEAIGVLYTSQSGFPLHQSAVALLLPVVKVMSRYFQLWVLKDSKSGLGTAIISFEGQFFSSLYASVFLQTTDNYVTIVIIMLMDFLENSYDLYVLAKLANAQKTNPSSQKMKYLLFQTEKLVLIEFVEMCTPIMYAIYLVAMRHHPNAVYVKGLRDMQSDEYIASIWNLALLAVMEGLSLLILLLVLVSKYELPVVHQLGFTIDQYKWMLVTMMAKWAIIATTAQIEHYGNDYTFRFDWL